MRTSLATVTDAVILGRQVSGSTRAPKRSFSPAGIGKEGRTRGAAGRGVLRIVGRPLPQ